LIKSEEQVFRFASEKAEKLFKLSSELSSVESSLEGKYLIAETDSKLKNTKLKILGIFDEQFDVSKIYKGIFDFFRRL
jgi:hypothetical protein